MQHQCKQRRRSSLKSGGRASGSKNFNFFRQFHKKISIFPGKFLKNVDFSRQIFEKCPLFQAISPQKASLSNILPVRDKIY